MIQSHNDCQVVLLIAPPLKSVCECLVRHVFRLDSGRSFLVEADITSPSSSSLPVYLSLQQLPVGAGGCGWRYDRTTSTILSTGVIFDVCIVDSRQTWVCPEKGTFGD